MPSQSQSQPQSQIHRARRELQCGLVLDAVGRERLAVLKLVAREDEALLVRGDALLALDQCLHDFDSVVGLDVECDRLARWGRDVNLHVAVAVLWLHWCLGSCTNTPLNNINRTQSTLSREIANQVKTAINEQESRFKQ